MGIKVPSFTLISDGSRYPDELLLQVLEKVMPHGVDALLLREKTLSSAKLLALASKLRKLTRAHGAALYIHTQADVAAAVDADGVHLSGSEISHIPAVRNWLDDACKSVSVSCHSPEQIRQAECYGADFIFLSPLFATASHPGAPHLGVQAFHNLASQTALPAIALGGIDSSNCDQIPGQRIAVISALLAAEEPAVAAQKIAASIARS